MTKRMESQHYPSQEDGDRISKAEREDDDMSIAEAEVAMLRGVGCLEDGGPCGVCIKCLRIRAEKAESELARALTYLDHVSGQALPDDWR